MKSLVRNRRYRSAVTAVAAALTLALFLPGCGGGGNSGGGGSGDGTDGGIGSGPSQDPANRARKVAALMEQMVPRARRVTLFGDQTDAVEAVMSQQINTALDRFDTEFAKAQNPAATTRRYEDNGPTTPSVGSATPPLPIDMPAITVGPFTIGLHIVFRMVGGDNTFGYEGKASIPISGALGPFTVHATVNFNDKIETEYCPTVAGKFHADESATIAFDGTVSEPGFHSISASLALDKTITGNVDDSAEVSGLDSVTDAHTLSSLDGPIDENGWHDQVTGDDFVRQGANAWGKSDITFTNAAEASTVTLLQALQIKARQILEVQELLVLRDAARLWKGGRCIQIQHLDEEAPLIKPGTSFPVELKTVHLKDGSTVQNTHYTVNIPAEYYTENPTGSGHLQFTVPDDIEKAKSIYDTADGVIVEVASRRGKARIRHQYHLGMALDSMRLVPGQASSTLTLFGQFGAEKGSVTISGRQVSVAQWGQTQIVCDIPNSGPGSYGDVLVTNSDATDATFPTRHLTDWQGEFHLVQTYTFPEMTGSTHIDQTFRVHFRGDIGPTVDPDHTSHPGPLLAVREEFDSTGSYTAAGTSQSVSDSGTGGLRYSGRGDLHTVGANPVFHLNGTVDPASGKITLQFSENARPGFTQTLFTDTGSLDFPEDLVFTYSLSLTLGGSNVMQAGQKKNSVDAGGGANQTVEWRWDTITAR